jgi:hypothetical protein
VSYLSVGEYLTIHLSSTDEYPTGEDGYPRQDPTNVHGSNPAQQDIVKIPVLQQQDRPLRFPVNYFLI